LIWRNLLPAAAVDLHQGRCSFTPLCMAPINRGGIEMRAKDLMTKDVITVRADTAIKDVAQILLSHRISAVPVTDENERLIGIVSEGDLLRRTETGTERPSSWWLDLIATPEQRADDYVKSHATHVRDVMTTKVATVEEDTEVSRIATLLEEKRIKRVPVTKDGRVVGIVSRADLLRGIATAQVAHAAEGDDAIRAAVVKRLRGEAGVRDWLMNVTVADGVVHMWGGVRSEAERRAARVAAETVSGVRSVEDHLTIVPGYIGP
jgi:CBS domain-containing protein